MAMSVHNRSNSSSQQQTNPWGISTRQGRSSRPRYIREAQTFVPVQMPGGRRLWWQLVMGMTLFALIGVVFIIIGSVFFNKAQQYSQATSLPAIFCIISIVLGISMMILSVVMAKLFISNKWRKNQQPVYENQQSNENTRCNTVYEEQRTRLDYNPPSYEQSMSQVDIYMISNGNGPTAKLEVPLHPFGYAECPPSYEESTEERK